MKRYIWLLPLAVLLFAGFRTTGYRSDNTIYGDMYFYNDIWLRGDTLFLTDGGADTSYIVQNGTYLFLGGDNSLWVEVTTYTSHILPRTDTTRNLGSTIARWGEVWALRHCWLSPDKADSGKVYDDGTNSYIQADNPLKFACDVMPDSFMLRIGATGENGATGYATTFVDTTGTDSLIIMVGSTRRGIPIE